MCRPNTLANPQEDCLIMENFQS
uniref:Uncharacterized protein n=1 Tax=Anguilla anguilla TaxID=7936 RepID=A0A0E9UM51_ANGAN